MLYSRPYFYRLVVSSEKVNATAGPTARPIASVPAPPNDVIAVSSTQMELSWTPPSGATGYRIYRSRYYEMTSCESSYDFLGHSWTPTFIDVGAPHGVPLHYKVSAYNHTGASALSNDATGAITTDSQAEEPRATGTGLSISRTREGFRLNIPSATLASGAVFDVSGRLIAKVLENELRGGAHLLDWSTIPSRKEACRRALLRATANTRWWHYCEEVRTRTLAGRLLSGGFDGVQAGEAVDAT